MPWGGETRKCVKKASAATVLSVNCFLHERRHQPREQGRASETIVKKLSNSRVLITNRCAYLGANQHWQTTSSGKVTRKNLSLCEPTKKPRSAVPAGSAAMCVFSARRSSCYRTVASNMSLNMRL